MALIRANTSGGGGSGTETPLWTNSNPTSNFDAGTTPLTLSDDLSNYDELKIEYCKGTSATSTLFYIKFPIADFLSRSADDGRYVIGGRINGVSDMARTIFKGSANNQLHIGQCYYMYGTTVNNAYYIPLNIYGVKY